MENQWFYSLSNFGVPYSQTQSSRWIVVGDNHLGTRWTALEDFINITARKSVKQGRSFSTKVVPPVIASFFSSRFKPSLEVLRILRNIWTHFVQPQDLHQSSAARIILWSSTLASPHQAVPLPFQHSRCHVSHHSTKWHQVAFDSAASLHRPITKQFDTFGVSRINLRTGRPSEKLCG